MPITGINGTAIQLPHDTAQCLNQTVEYQCTVSGSDGLGLRIFRDDGTRLFAVTIRGTVTIGLFRVEELSMTPLVFNISFTAVSSIDRYTIVCVDTNTMNNITILINIAGKNYSKLVYYEN